MAGVEYKLTIEGEVFAGKTDADGMIEVEVPIRAQRGELIVRLPESPDYGEARYEVYCGALDPVSEASGVLARLSNLDLYAGPVHGVDEERLAQIMRTFQYGNRHAASGQSSLVIPLQFKRYLDQQMLRRPAATIYGCFRRGSATAPSVHEGANRCKAAGTCNPDWCLNRKEKYREQGIWPGLKEDK